ncbi:hypothetical protein M9Y10_000675 [Tritrichomonas musculus]|uniref:Uncharacterized protein n=1 Tax=Tritrichomonas musculus TaxID=1915356 RepID=A0ABR2L4V8_9EUKA
MSINLSFKEWPFLALSKRSKKQPVKPTTTNNDSDLFSLPSFLTGEVKSFFQSIQLDDYITDVNKYPVKYQLSSWGPCGLFACTYESSLSIFSNDEKGNLTQILMFSPFEKYSFGKFSKQPSKGSNITAISWANGHLEPYIPKPVLAVSSERGNVLIYNIKTRNIINTYNFGEPIVSILWSSFKINRFYAGSSTGHFFICEVCKKSIEIIKMFDFSENSAIITENICSSVDFITQDDVDGFTVAIASRDGTVGCITNLNDPSQSQLHIFQNLNFSENNKKSNFFITFFEFYPNNQNFILVSTNTSTFIISVIKSVLVPFINRAHCKFISVLEAENDKIIFGDSDSLTVYKLSEKSWVKLNVLKLPEILTFSKHDDKILLTTVSNWLTEIEYKRDRLFVTRRTRLIARKPIDFDCGDGTIAFLTNHNSLHLTRKTPESIIRSKFTNERPNSPKEEGENIRGNSNTISLSFNILPTEETDLLKNVGWISDDKLIAWCEKTFYLVDLKRRLISEPLKKIFDRLSNSITQIFFSKSCHYIGIVLNYEQVYFLDTRSNLDIVYSIDFNGIITKGCNCLFGSISPNEERVVFVSDSSIFFANLDDRNSLKKIPSNLKFNPSSVSWTDKSIIIGTEKGSAFSIKNSKIENLSEISKKDVKVIYDSLHIDDPYSQCKLGPIKSVLRHQKSYVILDVNGQGIIVSDEVKTIAESIEIFKQCSNETFLISVKNYNKIIAINAFDEFVPHLPPCFYSTQTENISFYASKSELIDSFKDKNKVNLITKRIFATNDSNYSFLIKNSIELLIHILSFYDSFNSLTSRVYLKLGNMEMARNALLRSNRNDKEYLNNLLIASFYEADEKNESAQLIVKNLLSNNMINEAVDILLITKDVHSALKILCENGRNKEAFFLLMLNNNENESSEIKEIAKKVARSLYDKKENVLYGLKLLSTFGYTQEMLDLLSLSLS